MGLETLVGNLAVDARTGDSSNTGYLMGEHRRREPTVVLVAWTLVLWVLPHLYVLELPSVRGKRNPFVYPADYSTSSHLA
jgi:hypothetical protein